MTGPGSSAHANGGQKREYPFTPWIVRNGGIVVLIVLAMIGLTVWGLVTGDLPDTWQMAAAGAIAVAAFAWTVSRNLVLGATLEGDRLHVRTATAHHEVAVDALTEISWRVDESRLGSLNPLNKMTARLRYHGRTLRVPMPDGGTLLRDLEAARSPGRAGRVREFDYTALVHSPFIGPTTVRYATFDGRTLHAVTGDDQEHDVPLDTIEDIEDLRDGMGEGGHVIVHHRGGDLRIGTPFGAELADRLLAARAAP